MRSEINIFIFKPYSESVVYGVGSYINALVNFVSEKYRYYIVELFYPDCKSFVVINKENYILIKIPFAKGYRILEGLSIDKYTSNSIWELISSHIGQNKNIFHFQTPFLLELAIRIKSEDNEFRIVYTLHKLRWKYYFNCSFQYFKYLMGLNLNNPYFNFVKSKLDQEKKICEISHGIIALTNQAKRYLINEYKITKEKIFLISNGINIVKKRLSKIHFTRKKNDFSFLFVGRICEEKGVRYLLKAFDDLANEIPNIKLFVAGSGELPNIKLNNGSKIKFLGYLNKKELCLLYSQSDVGLILSLNEECSYVALEMMNNHIPIICSNLSGLKEMFTHNFDALKVSFYYDKNHILKLNTKDIKSKMKELYENKKLRLELEKNAFLNLKKKYNIELMTSNTNRLYNKI